MANEFIARRGLKVLSAGASITGNLQVSTDISASTISGAFYGNGTYVTGVVTSSYAHTASAATSITFVPATASYAVTAGTTGGGVTGQGIATRLALWDGINTITSSLVIADNTHVSSSVPITASAFHGDGANITNVISSSYAFTASYASNAGTVNYSTGSYTGSFTGSLLGTASFASDAYAIWNNVSNKPVGLVSSSIQINTGSFTGSFTGTVTDAVSSSYALSASAATSITFTPASATYAGTDWLAINNKPTGIVSSSIQTLAHISQSTITPSIISASSIYVHGDITALQFNTQYVSSSIIYQSGSTKFGDTSDDVMSVTGTLDVSGTTTFTGPVSFTSGLGPINIAGALYSTGSGLFNVGTTVVTTVTTSSYDMAHFHYVVKNGLNTRTGVVMSVWSASVAEYTDTSTADIGDTTDISFQVDVVTGTARLKAVVAAVNGWTVKTIIQAI